MKYATEVTIDEKEYYVEGTFTKRFVDESFSHAFGIAERGHYEVDELIIDTVMLDCDEICPSKRLEADIKEKLREELV
jgi:hypothetical protein